MPGILNRVIAKFKIYTSEEDKNLAKSIKIITGKKPVNLSLFKLAMIHSSIAKTNARGFKESNERLEYLGDAVLGMVVAEYLFTRFPFKDEGFLTEIRAKIVNRESLNMVSKKIGLSDLIKFQQHSRALSPKSIYGDTLEALIGAIYLDRGFHFAKRYIIKKIIKPHYDLNELINTVSNYKSKIIEWAQKENKDLSFDIEEINDQKYRKFTATVVIDGETFESGYGSSKKKAEQDAARKTVEVLEI